MKRESFVRKAVVHWHWWHFLMQYRFQRWLPKVRWRGSRIRQMLGEKGCNFLIDGHSILECIGEQQIVPENPEDNRAKLGWRGCIARRCISTCNERYEKPKENQTVIPNKILLLLKTSQVIEQSLKVIEFSHVPFVSLIIWTYRGSILWSIIQPST